MSISRRVHDDGSLAQLAEDLGVPAAEFERDYVLVSIAAQLQEDFGDAFCFKGGFVLRHVHGQRRLSIDIDATRHNPARHKLDSGEVRRSINRAGHGLVKLRASEPATDSGVSLDFDDVAYRGPLGRGKVAVEVSYREALVLEPVQAPIGLPFFDPFEVTVMAPDEIVAEKLRTLVQRRRPTDLSDLAFLLSNVEVNASVVRRVVAKKFEDSVQQGDHATRIRDNIEAMAREYDRTISVVAPESPGFDDASRLVVQNLRNLLP